jgi:CheY-like chemotaxis protein
LWLLEQVRSLPRVLVVALTALTRQRDQDEIRAAGLDAHIVKPAEPDQIVEVIARLTGRA